MRRKFFISSSIIPLLFLLLLGGCLGPDYLVTSIGPAAPEEAASLREGEPHYTDHRAVTAKPEIVRIAIDEQLAVHEDPIRSLEIGERPDPATPIGRAHV